MASCVRYPSMSVKVKEVPTSEIQGTVISPQFKNPYELWKQSSKPKFVGNGEDIFLDEKGEYKLPECQC